MRRLAANAPTLPLTAGRDSGSAEVEGRGRPGLRSPRAGAASRIA